MAGTTTRPVKTAVVAAQDYVNNAGSVAAGTGWATGFLADPNAIFAAAAGAVSRWQAAVSTAQAAADYVAGLGNVNIQALTTKVNGPGKASYSSGVKVAGAPGGNYANFSAQFQPWLAGELTQLNRTNPRGDSGANRTRLNAYLDALEAQRGNFKQ